jgi:hypothetical protein
MNTIQLTVPQLISIFDQLGLPNTQFAPYVDVSLQLESFQLPSTEINVPLPNLNTQNLTVESIISSSKPMRYNSRINNNFIKYLADTLKISEKEFIEVIQSPEVGNLDELTTYLNKIFNGLIKSPLTLDEVSEMLDLYSF